MIRVGDIEDPNQSTADEARRLIQSLMDRGRRDSSTGTIMSDDPAAFSAATKIRRALERDCVVTFDENERRSLYEVLREYRSQGT